MRKFLIGAALAAMMAGPVLAADIPVKGPVKAPPPLPVAYNWTGFYIGVSGGGIWGDTQWQTPALGAVFPFDGDGGIFGGTIGYNWQTGPWVIGIEADYSATSYSGTQSVCAGVCTSDLNTFGTVRGRLGYATGATGSILLYVTGGFAFGEVENNVIGTFVTKSDISGWTVGGGIEFALVGRVTVKAEYLYADLGGSTVCTPAGVGCGGNFGVSDFVRPQVARVGVNYRF